MSIASAQILVPKHYGALELTWEPALEQEKYEMSLEYKSVS